jgi:hypothetical protein
MSKKTKLGQGLIKGLKEISASGNAVTQAKYDELKFEFEAISKVYWMNRGAIVDLKEENAALTKKLELANKSLASSNSRIRQLEMTIIQLENLYENLRDSKELK